MRYVVTEIEGYLQPSTSSAVRQGLSVHVEDTAFNRRVVFTARTEDFNSNALDDDGMPMDREQRRALIRERAAVRCDLLNRLDEIAREAQGAVA